MTEHSSLSPVPACICGRVFALISRVSPSFSSIRMNSFNQLDLPAYETFDKLKTMLLLAVRECSEGFGFA